MTAYASFHPPGEVVPHIVLEWSNGRPPGRLVTYRTLAGRVMSIYFNPPAMRGQPGLHNDHYIGVVPTVGPHGEHVWISAHAYYGASLRERLRANVAVLMRIARSLTTNPPN